MGVLKAAASRRATSILAVTTVVFGVLVGIAGPAQALHVCSVGPGCPAAVDDTYTTTFDTKLTVDAAHGLLVNDSGPSTSIVNIDDSDTTSFNGADVLIHSNGSFTYTPDPNNPYSGTDSFDYEIDASASDNSDSDTATATINVLAVVGNDSYNVAENHTLNVAAPGVFANDRGFDNTSVLNDDTTAHGVPITVNDDGSFSYTPPHNFTGTDSFTYEVTDLDFENDYTATVTLHVLPPAPPVPPKPKGYWMVGATGTVYPFGQVKNYGNAPTGGITHLEPTPSRKGYWVVNAAGSVFAFGDAKVFGATPSLRPGEAVTSLSSTPTGKGYWLFTNRGRAVARGDAKFFGDVHTLALNGPIVGSVATPTGKGYYLVGSDGGIFSFGDAKFHGSMGGVHLNQPVDGIVPTSTNRGYWLVASDGGIFGFGDAGFRGSMGGAHLNRPIIGMVRYGNGYLMVASDGGIFAFSNLPFLGSLGGEPLPAPIVGVGAGG